MGIIYRGSLRNRASGIRSAARLVVAVLAVVCGTVATSLPANAAGTTGLSEEGLVGQATYLAKAFDIIGAGMSDLPDGNLDQNVLWNLAADAAARVGTDAGTRNVARSAATAQCDDTNRFLHARQTAAANMDGDANAKGLEAETVYMFLSHYVDVPASYRSGPCAANDEEPYYANWITNDDRNVYDSFLRVSGYADAPRAVSSAISGIAGAVGAEGTGVDFYKSITEKNVIGAFYDLLSAGSLADSTLHASVLEDIRVSIRDIAGDTNLENEDAHEVVDRLINRLSAKTYHDWFTAADTVCVALAFLASGGSMLDVGIAVVQLGALFGAGLAQTAAVSGMIASLSGRTSGRLMRAWGA